MCSLSQLSGVLTIRADGRTAVLQFPEGETVQARAGRVTGADAVQAFITWRDGRLDFVPGDPIDR